ncbi:hypothetical protein ABMA27_004827 [Loxostege sticticalis]|uniref:Uncharacterized protein n=1 Tax=Loxostege sticticalis TaxID=481309 RepID=A0ABR3HKU1_LOXSC
MGQQSDTTGEIWRRTNEHERNPSSLHEYLDAPLPKRGASRCWLPILLAVPLAYYMIVASTSDFIVNTSNKIPDSDQEKESFMSIPIRYSSALFLLHNDTCKLDEMTNKTL